MTGLGSSTGKTDTPPVAASGVGYPLYLNNVYKESRQD